MTRIEIHLPEEETKQIEAIAKIEGRSRKKQIEVMLRGLLTTTDLVGKK